MAWEEEETRLQTKMESKNERKKELGGSEQTQINLGGICPQDLGGEGIKAAHPRDDCDAQSDERGLGIRRDSE